MMQDYQANYPVRQQPPGRFPNESDRTVEKMRDNAEYAKKLQKGYLIYDRGYGLLTGQDVQTELLLGAECIIMTILAVFSICSI